MMPEWGAAPIDPVAVDERLYIVYAFLYHGIMNAIACLGA